jgi:hypothetical protein
MSKQCLRVMSAAIMAVGLLMAGRATAGSLDPTNAPGPTMHTLEEIYQKVQNLAPQPLQTLSSNTAVVNAGYYASTNLTQVDADLAAGNIVTGIGIFGVTGTAITATGNATESQVLGGSTFSAAGASGLTGTMTDRGAVAITPGTAPQTIAQGYHNGSGSVSGDANLVTGNIKSGTTIFGVAGKSSVVETATGTAVAGDMLASKTAYVNGALITGTMASQTLSAASATVTAGYYASTNLTQVDTDLMAGNIMTNVTIFGVVGILSTNTGSGGGGTYSAAVPKTGQTTSYQTGDDGDYEKGVAWPNPRFTVQADTNCVTDNLTGLIWARNANMGGPMTWSAAITYCEALNYGGQTDWRLPNAKELYSLIDLGRDTPALPTGHPFAGVRSDYYWSSSTYAGSSDVAWNVALNDGGVYGGYKTYTLYVWPVRGGQ